MVMVSPVGVAMLFTLLLLLIAKGNCVWWFGHQSSQAFLFLNTEDAIAFKYIFCTNEHVCGHMSNRT